MNFFNDSERLELFTIHSEVVEEKELEELEGLNSANLAAARLRPRFVNG